MPIFSMVGLISQVFPATNWPPLLFDLMIGGRLFCDLCVVVGNFLFLPTVLSPILVSLVVVVVGRAVEII